jgi:hypothetical protein
MDCSPRSLQGPQGNFLQDIFAYSEQVCKETTALTDLSHLDLEHEMSTFERPERRRTTHFLRLHSEQA